MTDDPLPRIFCDPDRIQQLFENLLRNALVHRGACAPIVHIQRERTGRELAVFRARLNGPAIEPDYLERIFQPFERLRGQQSPGPGLPGWLPAGKSSRTMAARMLGRESEEERGSTFYFTLPAEPKA